VRPPLTSLTQDQAYFLIGSLVAKNFDMPGLAETIHGESTVERALAR
jgi:hypothetical protein